MNYVKHFHINGVNTSQVACIELQGAPNTATEGAVGVLGMDMTSPTHEVYRCVAVNGNVYTWELLSAGMSILSAQISGEGALAVSFPYTQLLMPTYYVVKVGDLILDSEGYLYQISAIGNDRCDTTYCGTRIGGIAGGDKDRRLTVVDGKLQLVTEGGNVLSALEYLFADGTTLYRDTETGVATVLGVKTVNGTYLRFYLGTQAGYDALSAIQKQNLFAIITDDKWKENLEDRLSDLETANENLEDRLSDLETANESIINGTTTVGVAKKLDTFIHPPLVDWGGENPALSTPSFPHQKGLYAVVVRWVQSETTRYATIMLSVSEKDSTETMQALNDGVRFNIVTVTYSYDEDFDRGTMSVSISPLYGATGTFNDFEMHSCRLITPY